MYSKLVVDIISQVNRLSCTDIHAISFFLLYAVLVHVVYKSVKYNVNLNVL